MKGKTRTHSKNDSITFYRENTGSPHKKKQKEIEVD